MRWLRRWWARITHRHDWVVIYRCTLTNDPSRSYIRDCPVQIKRCYCGLCYCGLEEASIWTANWSFETRRWNKLDLDLLNHILDKQNIEIPARHQE